METINLLSSEFFELSSTFFYRAGNFTNLKNGEEPLFFFSTFHLWAFREILFVKAKKVILSVTLLRKIHDFMYFQHLIDIEEM